MNGYGGTAALLQDGRVLVASSGTGDVYSPATGTWTPTGPMVFPYASAAAALLPNGQVLYAGGGKVKYCGPVFLRGAHGRRRAVHPLARNAHDRMGARSSLGRPGARPGLRCRHRLACD
jgi:hypothetical protein